MYSSGMTFMLYLLKLSYHQGFGKVSEMTLLKDYSEDTFVLHYSTKNNPFGISFILYFIKL